jgi:hypothetical protein
MMNLWLGIILDLVVIGLLLAAIPSFYMLSRRLKAMKDGQDGLKSLVEGLNFATEQARRSVSDLKLAAAQAGQELESQINSARRMADELALIIDAGDNLANRLESAIAAARVTASPARAPVQPEEDDEPAPVPDRDLLKALKTVR